MFVRRDPKTGDVILSRKPESWGDLFELHEKDPIPDDFMGPADRLRMIVIRSRAGT
ncbi:hypothetical protein [Rhizobium sp. N324]|uniref:hypothetical protein n=1 Tax=Rhizobium sp. N324 TaxID=1703969 RepID=UPI000B2423E3|nr:MULTISPECIES: hypothetical protein [unclassified Rhizobium]OYD04995.1 VapB protein (antitoxin to VapC) [Rhizobium sp. N4311]